MQRVIKSCQDGDRAEEGGVGGVGEGGGWRQRSPCMANVS